MKKTMMRGISWVLSIMMAVSMVTIPCKRVKAADTEFSFVDAMSGSMPVSDSNDAFVDFAFPTGMMSKEAWSKATSLSVTFTASYTAKAGEDTPGTQVFFQSKDTTKWNANWLNLSSGTMTQTLTASSLDWGSSTEVNRYGLQFNNLQAGSTVSYAITNITLTTSDGNYVQTAASTGGGGGGSADSWDGGLIYTLPDTCVDDATSTPFSGHGPLHVDTATKKLQDANNNDFQLRGVSTHGINWDDVGTPYVNFDSIKNARDILNANAIRLAMYTADYYGYADGGPALGTHSQSYIQDSLKYRVDKGVKCADALGMYCIVDWHILSDSTPQTYKEDAKKFFAYVSNLYKDHNNIIYEICNEPNGGTSWRDIKDYAKEIIPIIRANDPDALIIVGTPSWSQNVDEAAAEPILEKDVTKNSTSSALAKNVMYTIHFYANTHGEDPYLNRVKNTNGKIPIMCTEFGMCDSSGEGTNNFDMSTKWLDYFDSQDISYFCWSLCKKGETASLLSSGTLGTWNASNLSESGNWIKTQYTNRKNTNNSIETGIEPYEPVNPTDDSYKDDSDKGDKSDKVDKTDENQNIAVTSISIEGISKKIAAGKKITLEAVVTPENATNHEVEWTSSNTKYATVDKNGVVKTKKAGAGKSVTITITALDGSGQTNSYNLNP